MNLRRIPIPLIITTLFAARVVCHNEQQKQIFQAKQAVIDSVKQADTHKFRMPASDIYAQITATQKAQENMEIIKTESFNSGYNAAVDSMEKVSGKSDYQKGFHEGHRVGWNSRKNFTSKIRAEEAQLTEQANRLGQQVMRSSLIAKTAAKADSIKEFGTKQIKLMSNKANTLVYMHGDPVGYRYGKGHLETVYKLAMKAVADTAKAALKK